MFETVYFMERNRDGNMVYYHFPKLQDSIVVGHYDFILSFVADRELKPFRSWVNVSGKTVSKDSREVQVVGTVQMIPGPVIHKFKSKESLLMPKTEYSVILRDIAASPIVEIIRGRRIVAANYHVIGGQIIDQDGGIRHPG